MLTDITDGIHKKMNDTGMISVTQIKDVVLALDPATSPSKMEELLCRGFRIKNKESLHFEMVIDADLFIKELGKGLVVRSGPKPHFSHQSDSESD